jgi:hypothetical protein
VTRPWTLAGLSAAYVLSAAGFGLDEIAEAIQRDRTEVDIALGSLLGRSVEEALFVLNRRTARPARLVAEAW